MVRRKTKRQSKHDVDTMLRHVSRSHGRTLSRILFGTTEPIQELTWIETQLAARQRRVDRAMSVKIGDQHRWQHIEWTDRLTYDVRVRVYEYNHLLVMAAYGDGEAESVPGEPPVKPVTVDSVVVVLTGPKQGLPKIGFYRTSSRGEKFSGIRFRIEAIYLRSVAEIEAMDSVFWLVFVPLAVDADEQAVVRAIETIRTRTNPHEFADLLATMFSIAKLKKDRPTFVDVIQTEQRRQDMYFIDNELTREWMKEGIEKGLEEGRKLGLEKGLEKGLEEGRKREQKALLLAMVERRLKRSLTPDEHARFTVRLKRKGGAQEMANAVIDFSADELVALLKSTRLRKSNRNRRGPKKRTSRPFIIVRHIPIE
jgi:hypothetical protein